MNNDRMSGGREAVRTADPLPRNPAAVTFNLAQSFMDEASRKLSALLREHS